MISLKVATSGPFKPKLTFGNFDWKTRLSRWRSNLITFVVFSRPIRNTNPSSIAQEMHLIITGQALFSVECFFAKFVVLSREIRVGLIIECFWWSNELRRSTPLLPDRPGRQNRSTSTTTSTLRPVTTRHTIIVRSWSKNFVREKPSQENTEAKDRRLIYETSGIGSDRNWLCSSHKHAHPKAVQL